MTTSDGSTPARSTIAEMMPGFVPLDLKIAAADFIRAR